jgi:serine/threonine protein kinase
MNLEAAKNAVDNDKFLIKKALSSGTFGSVFLAYDHSRHESVAIKIAKKA